MHMIGSIKTQLKIATEIHLQKAAKIVCAKPKDHYKTEFCVYNIFNIPHSVNIYKKLSFGEVEKISCDI